ncbi:cell division protein ZipA [Litchfieldella xinjiangensis]|uniref:cell division protein ZipA n=1 Tax=Litchfieldella xinjiangensis TaxID=1166948 RepID=UPI0005B98ACE|nr:cell division protein ZipA [Halomonas xinjiangensis]
MELREWLIILGLALVSIIVIDGIRRLQRQRRVPRLDQVDIRSTSPEVKNDTPVNDPDEAAREAELQWELPNGGARVVKPATYDRFEGKPKLKRQEHPGPSTVLSNWRKSAPSHDTDETHAPETSTATRPAVAPVAERPMPVAETSAAETRPTDSVAPQPDVTATQRTAARAQAAPHHSEPAPREAEPQVASQAQATAQANDAASRERSEPTLSALETEPRQAARSESQDMPGLAADPEDHDEHLDAERYRIVDLDGMSDSFKSNSLRMGASMQRFGASLSRNLAERKTQRRKEKLKREQEKAERKAREASRRQQEKAEREAHEAERLQREKERSLAEDDYDDPLFAPSHRSSAAAYSDQPRYDQMTFASTDEPLEYGAHDEAYDDTMAAQHDVVTPHPVVEKALRHDVNGEHARDTLSHAEEVIVISVMSRDEAGFSGTALLDLMLACGLRYSREMGIFHRFETEDPLSELQFSMVNVVKPGTFPLQSMDEFSTPGITLLMPLPGAHDTSAAFEAMVETAMVVVRHLGGELKDENRSVMTAQTVEFARQRVHEFERRHRLHRYQAN